MDCKTKAWLQDISKAIDVVWSSYRKKLFSYKNDLKIKAVERNVLIILEAVNRILDSSNKCNFIEG